MKGYGKGGMAGTPHGPGLHHLGGKSGKGGQPAKKTGHEKEAQQLSRLWPGLEIGQGYAGQKPAQEIGEQRA